MRPGVASVCDGTVSHCRLLPTRHQFRYPVSYVWVDPDRPDELTRCHPLWSSSRPAPARFRRRDYGTTDRGSLGDQVRDELEPVIGRRPSGEVRLLTQVRRWGWLFNPISVFVAWDADPRSPVGAVLEVTNTPWKERHRYALDLRPAPSGEDGLLVGRVAKMLHVSPFLDEEFEYVVSLYGPTDDVLELGLDVVPIGSDRPILTTDLRVDRVPATREALGRALLTNVASTHRVSLGIHVQALRLWLKRVPFVPHPSKRDRRAPAQRRSPA